MSGMVILLIYPGPSRYNYYLLPRNCQLKRGDSSLLEIQSHDVVIGKKMVFIRKCGGS
jgi:hypothetical protein